MKKWGLSFLYVFLVSVLVVSCKEENLDLRNQKTDEGKVNEITSSETDKNDTTNKDTVENNTSKEITENNNEEENEEELLEPEEINHAILTSKGFALLSDEGVVSYEGYDPEDNPNWVRFAAIKDTLTSIRIKNIYSNNNRYNPAFVALSEDGDVFAWGNKNYGGDPTHESEIYPEVSKANGALKDVVRIYSTQGAFAALTKNKTVITWGYKSYGGDTNYQYAAQISSPLTDVVKIYSIENAFAALKSNKDVEVWGGLSCGCGEGAIHGELNHIDKVYVTHCAFAMLKSDSSVVTRGDYCYGAISSAESVNNVEKIFVADNTFLAVRNNDTAFVMDTGYLGEKGTIDNVEKFFSNTAASGVLKSDKTITVWEGNTSQLQDLQTQNKLNDVKDIYYHSGAIFALKEDGSALTWKDNMLGDTLENVNSTLGSLNDIKYIVSSDDDAFGYGGNAAHTVVRENGNVIVWGDDNLGGNPNSDEANIIQPVGSLTNIKDVVASCDKSSKGAFAALRNDGTATSWGHESIADTTSIIASSGEDGTSLIHIKNIYGSNYVTYFVGVREDGSYVAWGSFEE